jgi:hypothetical protein
MLGFFVWSGYARGWWKEALTTAVLAVLIFLLQQPDYAQSLIDTINNLLATVWNALPASVTSLISDGLNYFLGLDTGGSAVQLSANSPGAWVTILILIVGLTTMLGRTSFRNTPTLLGSLLGAGIGGVNGFLVLNLIREYLDGRALPGNTSTGSELALAGSSAFGAAAPTVTIQATNLPNFTILDSVFPWILIGSGLFFLISVLHTRVKFETNKEGGRRINFKKLPPFYIAPPSLKQ